MKQLCLTNTQEDVNDYSFTRQLVNSLTHLRMKKIFLKILCFALFPFIGILPAKAFSGSGNGVSGNAYIITTPAQLAEIADASSAYYELGADIPLTGDWTPIASFSGTLDGKGHFITGLQINSTAENTGLFAQASGTITNLGITTTETGVKGAAITGAMVGRASGDLTISNSCVIGNVSGTGARVGGILGGSSGAGTMQITIQNCYFNGNVTSTDAVAGIIGGFYCNANTTVNITIGKCYVAGNITANSGTGATAGGVFGNFSYNNTGASSSLNISNCTSMCATIAGGNSGNAGRIHGYIKGATTLSNNYAFAGTIISNNGSGSTISTGTENNQHGLNKTKVELKTPTTYSDSPLDWDFTDTWTMGNDNYPFPVLKNLSSENQPKTCPEYLDDYVTFTIPTQINGAISVDPANAFIGSSVTVTVTPNAGYRIAYFTVDGTDKTNDLTTSTDNATLTLSLQKESYTLNAFFTDFTGEGKGTADAPFILISEAELNMIRTNAAAYFRLGNDIPLTSQWEPVTNFTGTFDGNGKIISNLQINSSADVNTGVGFFGRVTGATIRNLGIKGIVKALYRAGGIAGQVESPGVLLENCCFDGEIEVTATDNTNVFAGGIVGYNNWTKVEVNNCYVTGSIKSGSVAGGIIARSNGNNFATTVRNSYVLASIEASNGSNIAGGISGEASTGGSGRAGSLTISNCAVVSPSISGTTANRISGNIANNGITATLTGNFAFDGTLVNETNVTEGAANNQNGLDKTAKELTQVGTFAGWDFNTVWTLGNNSPDGATYYPLPVLKTLPAAEQAVNYPDHLKYNVNVATFPAGNGLISSHTNVQSGDDVTINVAVPGNNWDLLNAFTVNETDKTTEIKDLSGAYRIENITDDYELSAVFDTYTVAAGGTNTASNYLNGDIEFYSDDTNPAGQLTGIAAEGLPVKGAVKLIKTFTEKQWYSVGFPFEIAGVIDQADGTVLEAYDGDDGNTAYTGNGSGDYWLKYYDGENNVFKFPGSGTKINAHTGYIIQFPDYYSEDTPITVIFSSTPNPVLKNTGTLSQTLAATADNHGYYLVANPSVAKVASLNDVDFYYKYNNNHFGLLSGTDIELNPFEAIVAVKKLDETTPLRASLWIEGDPTGLRKPDAIQANDAVIETKYYNLQGVEIVQPTAAKIYIVKKIHASGKIEVTKSFYKANQL
ncbi:MAG: hypothetical protein LBG15_07000 [Dysgonamonadaceae bacterium]|jgi:hypothetical protein|nr:hypothetical protein [Dysgonamonadaceae bacterium]